VEPVGITFVALAVGGVLFSIWWFSEDVKIRRALKSTPTRAIATLQEGEVVRVTGRLRPAGDLLQAPLTGRPCAYYHVEVHESQKRGKSSSWVEIARELQRLDFEVVDSTGTALVRMDASQVLITRDAHSRSGLFDDATEAERAFLARCCQESTGFLGFNRALRYQEGVLEPDEMVTVLGQVTVEDRGGRRVVILGPAPGRPVLVSDERGVVAAR
jgi:hypothetical protein